MFYELRQYEAHTSRLNDLIDRFANVTSRMFERHGFRAVGYWREEVGIPHRVIYLLAWESWEAREKAWAAFYADPEWPKSRETYGETVRHMTNHILEPLPFSPLP